MATQAGYQTRIIKNIQDEPASYEFYQAVRLIERYLQQKKGELRFRVQPQLSFAVGDFSQLVQSETNGVTNFELFVTFLGLVGQSGVLPEPYTELILARLRAKDSTLLEFFDIFHDQFFELLYEVGNLSHFYVAYESQREHPIIDLLQAYLGQAIPELNEILLGYANLFGTQARSAEGLRLLLNDYFKITVQVGQYEAEWFNLNKEAVAKFSATQKIYLDGSVNLGKRIWHVQNRFIITLGPLSLQQFYALLPGGEMLPTLNKLVRAYVGLEFDYSIKLVMLNHTLPEMKISKAKQGKLGWNTWMTSDHKMNKPRFVIISHNKLKEI